MSEVFPSCAPSRNLPPFFGVAATTSLLHSAWDRLDYLHEHKGEISGIRTGFTKLDTLTTGLMPGRLPADPRLSCPPPMLKRE